MLVNRSIHLKDVTGVELHTEPTLAVSQMVPARAEVPNTGNNELERSIKAAMLRMKRVAADSDGEDGTDEETQSFEWDN